ncbi:hypothetical protein [Anabaena sp. UHCC 0204]|uniref:hypothetical protein n=1 Tax=Anabaena sp. UHCC 0204 TaxID=2590009 RepID=UPI001C2C63D8|nr:hypothetical protein [Anabaena sp. UHCC 0204]MTJ10539.1 hypothetical protein [Anabaena sp. UHCC 0204]
MQKHDNALMLMENPRSIYETLTGKRCSDTHWSKIKRLAASSDIPLDAEGLKGLIALRKINPRYFNLYPEIRNQLSEIGLSLGDFGIRISGENLVKLINERLNISPDITTVYRWFYRANTTFKRKQWYDRKTAMMVLTNALIYKAKNHRIGA